MQFEWNPDKEQSNVRKHGIGFAEASTVFGDPFEYMIPDPDHSVGEHHYLSLGISSGHRVLVVSYTGRFNGRIRIISATAASEHERRQYEQQI